MLFDSIAGLVDTVVKRIWPDASEVEQAKLEALKVALEAEMAIHETNKAEAQHPSIFVAGWRPFIGWICGIGLAYQFLLQPLASWVSTMAEIPVPPVIDLGSLIALLGGMLGLGVARTAEGMKGVKRSTWPQ